MTATADPADELFHPVGDHPAWSESYYFNFVDPTTGVGAFTRMGFRPNDGWADALHAVYLPEGRVAFTYGRRTDLTPAVVETLGPVDPAGRQPHAAPRRGVPAMGHRLLRRGPGHGRPDRDARRHQGSSRRVGSAPAQLDMDVAFEALSPPHYAVGGSQGHFEQTGRVTRLDPPRRRAVGRATGTACATSRGARAPGRRRAGTAAKAAGPGGGRRGLLPELVLDELRRRPGARRGVRQDSRRHVPRQGLDPARR